LALASYDSEQTAFGPRDLWSALELSSKIQLTSLTKNFGSICERMPYFDIEVVSTATNFVTEHPTAWGVQVEIFKYGELLE
jgi:hypothetical protein